MGMSEIRAAHDKTLVLIYAKNFFTERAVCKRRMVGKKIPPEWLKMRSALPKAFQNFKKRLLVVCNKETNS
jgi:hypothetical protein